MESACTFRRPQSIAPPRAARLLVVDDYAPNLAALERLLAAEGYVVSTATNGLDGLQAVGTERPDLLVLDVRMSGLDGVEVCRRVKLDPETCRLPVILVTGSGSREERLAALEYGADDFINKPVDPTELKTRIRALLRAKQLTDELESAEATVLALARFVEARDSRTHGHCERLATYATALGRALGLDDEDLSILHRGAFLHDIGKIGVPDCVLLKCGPLTQEEQIIMKRHTVIGDELCATMRSLHAVRPIVRHHHERWDGSGYPDGLKGDAIPYLAHIVSVVDVFDALTTRRPYRQAVSVERAYDVLLKESCRGWWHPALVETFIATHKGSGRSAA